MKEVSDITVLCFDHGLFIPVAERLARDCKRVLYHSPWEEGFSTINKAILGDGIENVERCADFWPLLNDIDLFVFPDIGHSGLQLHLESIGKPLWGSRRADRLETNREYFIKLLKGLDMDIPNYEVCVGITALREYLLDKEDCYVKISKYRGSLETRHWRSWDLDENLIDLWAVRFGASREVIPFLVFDAINTPIELGGDTYCVDGQFPSLQLHGIEAKDAAYFSAVTKADDMPEQVREVNDAFSALLAKERYRNEWSVEIRVKGDTFYFIDPTCRGGLPSTGSQLELWGNISEIIWAGAHGELVEPEPLAQYSAEVILSAKSKDTLWPTVTVPNQLQQWVKLYDCCEIDGVRSFPRESVGEDSNIGWLVAIGDTPTETLDTLKEYVSLLPDGLFTDIAPIADIIKEIAVEEKKGIEFADDKMPEVAEVLE